MGKGKKKTVEGNLGEKVGRARISKKLNKTIQVRESKFKTNNNLKILLRDSMAHLVEAISTQYIEKSGSGGLDKIEGYQA